MKSVVFLGTVEAGSGDATASITPMIPVISERSGLHNLYRGTLNVRLIEPYAMRNDFIILKHERPDGQVHHEDLRVDHCQLLLGGEQIEALIIRPIDHGDPQALVEIMAARNLRDAFGLRDGDAIEVKVRVG